VSIRYVERAIWAKGLGSTRKLVLIAIADAVSDNGIGWLLVSSLMKKTDLSERSVQAAIADLSNTHDGTVEPILEKRERAKRSSIFRIHYDRIPQHDHGISDKEMTAEEMWGAGDAPPKATPAARAPHPRSTCTQPPQEVHPEPSLEPSIETTPLSLTGETPPTDLFDGNSHVSGQLATARPTIIEHVKQGWASLVEDYPRIQGVRAWNDARKRAIARRAEEVVRASEGSLDAYQVWDQVFAAIRGDQWLRGDADPGRGHDRAYAVEIDHVLRTGGTPNFIWILVRAAANDRDTRVTSDPRTGRRLGPAEQSTHAALARLRSRRERG